MLPESAKPSKEVKSEKKGLFSGLFKKREDSSAKNETIKSTPNEELESNNDVSPIGEMKTTSTGNTFTKLFGKGKEKKDENSIIDTIVTQNTTHKEERREEEKKKNNGEKFIKLSKGLLQFSVAFIVLTAAFFYAINIDEENQLLGLFGEENYAIQLKSAAQEIQSKEEEEALISTEIERYKKGYENQFKDKIDQIVENRLNWNELISKLNEVTESVYEKNSLAQYVQYNNYSYDVNTGLLTVSGTLSDPLGKNLTKLAELEEAFMYYPSDKNNKDSEIEPYFYNLGTFQSYSKNLNQETGRYVSNFSLSVSTQPKKQSQ